jgi:hypothetical protein
MLIRAGRSPKPTRRWNPRCLYTLESAEKMRSSASVISLIRSPSLVGAEAGRSSHTALSNGR